MAQGTIKGGMAVGSSPPPGRAEAGPQSPGGGVRISSPIPEMFTTGSIGEAILGIAPPQQFLLENFFGNVRYFGGRFLNIDTRRARRIISPVNSRYHPGTMVERPVTKSQTYDVPKMAPYRVISLNGLDLRAPGQLANDTDAGQHAANIIADDSMELMSIIQRRAELIASQISVYGKS